MDHRKPSTMVLWKVDYHSSTMTPRDSNQEGLMTRKLKPLSGKVYLTADHREDQAEYQK
jgi:hypothetical protein